MEPVSIFDSIQGLMDEVEVRFKKELQPKSNYLAELVIHISKYKGKRLRPALVLLAGKCVGEIGLSISTLPLWWKWSTRQRSSMTISLMKPL